MRICFWGTCDSGKPRVRILLEGLRASGHELRETRIDPWRGIADKSQVKSALVLLRLALHILLAYPLLLARHALSRRNDVVICAYPGNLDILVLWPLAKLRRERLVLDAFLPLCETIVDDRGLLAPRGLAARLLHGFEQLSYRAADVVLVDTDAHGDYLASRFALPRQRVLRAFVGCETELFGAAAAAARPPGASPRVLFYGQFIPLHGMLTVLEAARLAAGSDVTWKIIGTGQEAGRFAEALRQAPLPGLEWVEWVDYDRLGGEIAAADVCLGIFGTTEKASRVIPNKVFQVIAAGRRLVTRDSAAIRELLQEPCAAVSLVPAGDAAALCAAVLQMVGDSRPVDYPAELRQRITPRDIGRRLAAQLEEGPGP